MFDISDYVDIGMGAVDIISDFLESNRTVFEKSRRHEGREVREVSTCSLVGYLVSIEGP